MTKQKARLVCPGCLRTHPEILKTGCGSQNCPPSEMMTKDDVIAAKADHANFDAIFNKVLASYRVDKPVKVTSLDDYAVWSRKMWLSDVIEERDITIMSLGLGGETGEVLELLKKRVRDDTLDLNHLKKELGDVLYYWSMLCNAFGLSPTDVMAANMEKVNGRYERGTLKGSGEDR